MNKEKKIHRKVEVVVEINPQRLAQANKWLRRKRGLPDAGRDEILDCISVPVDEFFDVEANEVRVVTADIKVCNSDQSSGPFVDPVLFVNGIEHQTIEVCDALDGEYHFRCEGNQYVIVIKAMSPAPVAAKEE